MAQRDYVRKNKPKKNNSRIIPNLMMTIAVILVILFVAILYFVSTNKSKTPITPPQEVTEKPQATLPEKPQERWTYLKELENPNNESVNQNSSTQAAQEKERQQILDNFMNDKPNSSSQPNNTQTAAVTTPEKTSPQTITPPVVKEQTQKSDASKENWLLQCGAFKDKANAESLKAKLAMVGVTSNISSEKFHRVLAGPYNNKSEATKAIENLKANGISSCIMTKK